MSQNLKILVVEDEPEAGHAVQRFLEFRGHTVALARDGTDAARLAEETRPEVMVCDWKLAGGDDGVEVVRQVQAQRDVAAIMVTAHRLSEARRRAHEADANISAFRRKPISLSDLASLVESLGGSA